MATRPAPTKKSGSPDRAKPPTSPKQERPVAEIVTGVIILLILVFMGLPKLDHWWHDYRVRQDVAAFHDNLTMAKNTAVEKRHPVNVTFDLERNAYTIHEDTNHNGTIDEGEFHKTFPLGKHIQYATRAVPEFKDVWSGQPITQGPVHLLGGGLRLTFNALGQASDNAAVYLVPTGKPETLIDQARAIQIHKTTGEIHIRRYTGKGDIPWN